MCGIFGTFSPNQATSIRIAKKAISQLEHRGPDAVGIWQSPAQYACLAHRRLSMVAPDNGRQPISNEDKNIVAVVNGEFYEHRDIRKRLEQLGHVFKSRCDSEIVVHLYEHYGLDFVDHLNGEFAFLIWDQKLRRMIAVRDRFGIKPLNYHIDAQLNVNFASEAKALLHGRHSNAINQESFFWASSLQYLPQERTLFDGIKLIPPGHFAIADGSGFRMRKYWDIDYPDQKTATRSVSEREESDAVSRTRELLTSAVMQRLDADAPVCFHLSGGLDSSSTLGIASIETGRRHQAFTIGFDSLAYDESLTAIETAKFCNADLNVIRISELDLVENILPAAMASEGLAINGHLPAKFLFNREIRRQGFSAAITGEGADETFLGYSHLKMDWWESQSISFRLSKLETSNQSSIGMMLPHGNSLCLDSVRKLLGHVPAFLLAKATLGFRVRALLNEDLLNSWKGRDAYLEMTNSAIASGQLSGRAQVHQSAWLWSKHALAGYILKTLGDGTEMASSIEGRLPFLDHRLFEFVRNQSVHQMFDGATEKHLLREAVKPYVTDRVYNREKHPFDAPPLLASESHIVRDFLYDQVNSETFHAQTMFDYDKVLGILNRVPKMDSLERQVWDPVFMMICTTLGIQQMIVDSSKIANAETT